MTIQAIALRGAVLCATGLLLSGCLAGMVVGAAVGVTGAVIGATAKGAGIVVGAIIPDGDKDEKKKR